MKMLVLAIALLVPSPVRSQATIPDDATKIKALKRAYQLNGCSMAGDISRGSVDTTQEFNKPPLPDPCVLIPKVKDKSRP